MLLFQKYHKTAVPFYRYSSFKGRQNYIQSKIDISINNINTVTLALNERNGAFKRVAKS